MRIPIIMESSEGQKKPNEDLVLFMRKRSGTDEPRYTARLKTYLDLQKKRQRAAASRRFSHHSQKGRHTTANTDGDKRTNSKKRLDSDKEKAPDNADAPADEDINKILKRRSDRSGSRNRSMSPAVRSEDPCELCRGKKRRRRRSCGRRRRRRRSCGRRRRRRRGCGRRRRRRSCGRRRRRRRSCRRRKRSCGRKKRSCRR